MVLSVEKIVFFLCVYIFTKTPQKTSLNLQNWNCNGE